MYHDGLVRFATHEYDLSDRTNKFVHLTNYSINKMSEDFQEANGESDSDASKWTLKYYMQ